MYGMGLDSMNLGAKLTLGTGNYGYENKDLINNDGHHYSDLNGWNYYDKENNSTSIIGLNLGAALKDGLDLSLGAVMNGSYSDGVIKTGIVKTSETIQDKKIFGIDLAGRYGLGNGLTSVLGINFNTGSYSVNTLAYDGTGVKTGDITTTTSNNNFSAGALIGKDIKATDTLTVKLASGAVLGIDPAYDYVTKDNMTGTKTYTTGTKNSYLYVNIPLNVAVEAKLNETWSLNAGVSTSLLSTENQTTKNNATSGADSWKDYATEGWLSIEPELDYAIGVTGKIGDLTLDCWMNPQILISGPNFLTGQNSGNLNYGVGLGYSWK
jgi:hypothetical protein